MMFMWKTLIGKKNHGSPQTPTFIVRQRGYNRRLRGNNLELYAFANRRLQQKDFLYLTHTLSVSLHVYITLMTTTHKNVCPKSYKYKTIDIVETYFHLALIRYVDYKTINIYTSSILYSSYLQVQVPGLNI